MYSPPGEMYLPNGSSCAAISTPSDKLEVSYEFSLPQTAGKGPAKADPHAWLGADGQFATTEPSGAQGHDSGGDLPESSA